jgi:protein SCO1/2
MEFSPGSARRYLLLAIGAVAAFAVGVYLARPPSAPPIAGLLWPDPPRLAPFSLDAAAGGQLTEAALQDHWTLVFFGFTHCPDVCPTTLATLKTVHAALQSLGPYARAGQVLFVSVDPARDTAQALQRYVSYFDPAFRAATGRPDTLEAFARQFNAIYSKVETGDPENYAVDHSASIFLVGPSLRLLGVFTPPHRAETLAPQVRAIMEFAEAHP